MSENWKVWGVVDQIVKQEQENFLHVEPYMISDAAKQILAHSYTPEGRTMTELLELIDEQRKEEA